MSIAADSLLPTGLEPGVVIPTTLDVKFIEIEYVTSLLREKGLRPIVIDCGVLGSAGLPAAVTREQVARAGGHDLDDLRRQRRRDLALPVMHEGLRRYIRALDRAGLVLGCLGIGGATNSAYAATCFRELPYGIPKLLVSTKASGDVRAEVGIKDVAILNSVVDVLGLNAFLRELLHSAVAMISSMIAERAIRRDRTNAERPNIAMTAFGCTTEAATQALNIFTENNFEVLAFHARGTGGMAAEAFIREGRVQAMFDLTTTEIADHIVGGVQSAGPDRLNAAADLGIPQVVLPGAIDVVNFGPKETVPAKFAGRRFVMHNPGTTLMRTTPVENAEIAAFIAEKLNRSSAPVAVVLPLRGFSSYDQEGSSFRDGEADQAFFQTIKETLAPRVTLREIDAHINDRIAMECATELLLDMYDRH